MIPIFTYIRMDKACVIKKAKELQRVAYRVVYCQDDDEYSYLDKYIEVTSWISCGCKELLHVKGKTDEEEAEICLAVLVGYSAIIRNDKNVQKALDRAFKVLPSMSASFIKYQLLIYCYAETYERRLADEAKEIMKFWMGGALNREEKRIQEFLKDLEEKNIMYKI